MDRARPVALALALLVAATARAAAAPCDPALGHAFTGPPEVGLRPAGLGAPRSPCRERALWLRLPGQATIDLPDFYGTLAGGLRAGLRLPRWGVEWSVDATLLDVRFAQNASLTATELTGGPLAVGALWATGVRAGGVPLALAPALRLVPPGTWLGVDGQRGGGELALHLGLRPLAWLTVDAHVGALAWLTEAGGGGTDARLQGLAAAGAGLRWRWLALLAGLEVATGWTDASLDHLLVRAGLRASTGAGAFDLAAALPLAGDDRTDAAVLLGWQLAL